MSDIKMTELDKLEADAMLRHAQRIQKYDDRVNDAREKFGAPRTSETPLNQQVPTINGKGFA